MNKLIALEKKAKIGIAASSSPFKKTDFQRSLKFIKSLGYRPVYTDSIFKKDGFVSGTPDERARDLIGLIKDDSISAIFFARGGYGSAQILPIIDKKRGLSKNIKTKIFCGYSDISAILCWVYKNFKQPVIYTPNITSKYFNESVLEYLSKPKDISVKLKELISFDKTIIKAPIFGGCLSVINSLTGTPYMPKLDGHILFLEDINEAPYKIDRMLSQLLMSGLIKKIRAIVLGNMDKCTSGTYSWKLPLKRIATILRVPVFYGLKTGHGDFTTPLPMGVSASLDTASSKLLIKSPFKGF